jgi:hypothetical protein
MASRKKRGRSQRERPLSYYANCPYLKKLFAIMNDANTIDTMDISLIKMFKLGPEVSLKGSPTVSPTTPALWDIDPLTP